MISGGTMHTQRQFVFSAGRALSLAALIVAGFHFAPRTDAGPMRAVAAAEAAPVVDTGNVYFIGDDIPIVVSTSAGAVSYTLEWIVYDRESIVGETYTGTGRVSDVPGVGRVAFLPTSMLTKKGVYFLSGAGISRRRILLVDPPPSISDPLTWPFGLITSDDQIAAGAAVAEEFYRVGLRWFHFDYPISTINNIGASSDPSAGRISAGFEAFINRAYERGLNPIFKLMSHYSQISGPTNLNGNFYKGLRKIQTYYQGKLRYWTIGNEVEGGGYSVFTPDQYATVIKNMSITLKGVDPAVRIIAGEFYAGNGNAHLDTLIQPGYRDYWDVLSGHRMVGMGQGTTGVAEFQANLEGLDKPIWDTEANGTIFGGPSEWSNYMQSRFPIVSDSDVHSGLNKHIVRTLCLETRDGARWLPAYYNPNEPCLGADLFIAMHYNASWETLWALRRHWISDTAQPSEQNHKVAGFRTVADMLYGAKGLTRIPNTDVPDPYSASPTATYNRADGYIYRNGLEYFLVLWQNTGSSAQDRELVLTTSDSPILYDSLGNRYPLQNAGGQVKVWVKPDAVYLRGFTSIPRFALDSTGNDAPYFVTTPITQAVAGQTYMYSAWAYDSDVPASIDDSLPRITYSLISPPAGMTIREGLVTWTPSAAGNYTIRIRASSANGAARTVDQVFTLDVQPAGTNLAPRILSHPLTEFGLVGYVWRYNVNAHDPNGDAVAYTLTQAPPGMTIDPASGFVQWVPLTPGDYPVTVSASDGAAAWSQSFTVHVAVSSSGPPIARQTASPAAARQNEPITFSISLPGNGRPITVTDTLPPQFDHLSSTTTCPLGSIGYNSGTREVAYLGAPPSGAVCAIDIAVRVNTGLTVAVVNTAVVDDDLSAPYNVSTTVVLNGKSAYLPIISKR
jgi:hypothetical protein